MSTRAFNLCLTVVLVLGVTASASAQAATGSAPAQAAAGGTSDTPTYELSGGYQILHVPNQTFPFGLNVDAARHYGKVGLVGEVGFAYDSEGEGAIDASAQEWNFGAGGRWTGFNSGRVWPFAQVLAGFALLHATFSVGGIDSNETKTAFMLQPGAGVNIVMGDGWGIVGQVDYRRAFFDEDEVGDLVDQFRVFIGARMILD